MIRILKYAFLILHLVCLSCDKRKHDCFDSSLVHNSACPAHCSGFEGCDGKTYCNACEAAQQGIGPK